MDRIERIRKKIKENPEGALAILDMMAQVSVHDRVVNICNDENLSPWEKGGIIMVFFDRPLDRVLDDKEIQEYKEYLSRTEDYYSMMDEETLPKEGN